jgi:16S rRNA pseudouridine516 synthase
MRIDKFIGNNTDLSRTLIHAAIKNGCIKRNDDLVIKTNEQMKPDDVIRLNNLIVDNILTRYLMLYKPEGYVCANTDSEHPTVLDLLNLPRKQNLQVVGRLDIDTTGLVLLTDDGQWNHRLTAPNHKCDKCYLVTTAEPISQDDTALFLQGILLKGEAKNTLPATLIHISSHKARVILQEGKYHQVKRMFAALGNRVVSLHRESIGTILLDSRLKLGEYRALTEKEISCFNH